MPSGTGLRVKLCKQALQPYEPFNNNLVLLQWGKVGRIARGLLLYLSPAVFFQGRYGFPEVALERNYSDLAHPHRPHHAPSPRTSTSSAFFIAPRGIPAEIIFCESFSAFESIAFSSLSISALAFLSISFSDETAFSFAPAIIFLASSFASDLIFSASFFAFSIMPAASPSDLCIRDISSSKSFSSAITYLHASLFSLPLLFFGFIETIIERIFPASIGIMKYKMHIKTRSTTSDAPRLMYPNFVPATRPRRI